MALLARRAGIGAGHLRRLEQGKVRNPRVTTVLALGEALGVPATALLDEKALRRALHLIAGSPGSPVPEPEVPALRRLRAQQALRRYEPEAQENVLCAVPYYAPGAAERLAICLDHAIPRDCPILVVCPGSPRQVADPKTGKKLGADVIGPRVGSMLRRLGIPRVFGTMEEPLDATTLPTWYETAPLDRHFTVVVDAAISVSTARSKANIVVQRGPVQPGSGLGRSGSSFGDLVILAHVGRGLDFKRYDHEIARLTNISRVLFVPPSRTQGMARVIARALYRVLHQRVQG